MNEELYPENPSAESGDEVQFGLMLGNPDTKTVYGVETGDVFPIYWVNGDKVQIYSPQCLDGRKSAEYQVSVSGTSQDYADALTKTGSYGIQWGKETKVHFYSLYPSGSYTLSSTGGVAMADNVVINHKQNISVNGSVVKSDMEDCLMYAHTAVDRDQTNTVNLTYTPISSVVYVTLKVEDTATGTEDTDYTIQSVKLLAYDKEDPELPQPIAGTFSLNLANGTFVQFKEGASYSEVTADIVDASTGGYHVLRKGDSVSLPLFFAPVSKLNVYNWKIQVIANNKTFTKTLNVDKVINPGQIHKITLPEFALNKAEWKEDTWMQNIPRNVYLSEISIPGTWNSLNTEFQRDVDITSQYNNGVRAFHFDTRWIRTGNFITGYNYPGLGTADNSGSSGTSGSKYMSNANNPTFRQNLTKIVQLIQGNPQEYMVVVCSFAQGSAQRNGVNGWIKEISTICNEFPEVYDARLLTKDTVVGDIVGKVIVIVNVETSISTSTVPSQSLAENSKCYFNYTPSEVPKDRFVLSGEGSTDLLSQNNDSFWTTTTTTAESNISVYSTQAQISSNSDAGITTNSRGYAPSMEERLSVLNLIVNWSKTNYGTANYAHDKWMYLGLGGYRTNAADASTVSGSHSVVENTLNPWIYNKVIEMGTTSADQTKIPFYPVGIVLMNNKKGSNYTDADNKDLKYGFNTVVKTILLLNNKYRLQYDPGKPDDYKPATTSAAASYSSGMHDQNVAAFGWD